MIDRIRIILLVVAFAFVGLGVAARRFPDVSWLRPFRPPSPSPREIEQMRRRSLLTTGVELILAGLVLAVASLILPIAFFNPLSTVQVILFVIVLPAALIATGVASLWLGRRR
jgi:hypothetical protein